MLATQRSIRLIL